MTSMTIRYNRIANWRLKEMLGIGTSLELPCHTDFYILVPSDLGLRSFDLKITSPSSHVIGINLSVRLRLY